MQSTAEFKDALNHEIQGYRHHTLFPCVKLSEKELEVFKGCCNLRYIADENPTTSTVNLYAVNGTKKKGVIHFAIPGAYLENVPVNKKHLFEDIKDDFGEKESFFCSHVVIDPLSKSVLCELGKTHVESGHLKISKVKKNRNYLFSFRKTHTILKTISYGHSALHKQRDSVSFNVRSPVKGKFYISQAFDSFDTHIGDHSQCVDLVPLFNSPDCENKIHGSSESHKRAFNDSERRFSNNSMKVYAVWDGKVEILRKYKNSGPHPDLFIRANKVAIKHTTFPNGNNPTQSLCWYSFYNHLSVLPTLKNHQIVKAGDVLGIIDAIGFTTGPHLCFSCGPGKKLKMGKEKIPCYSFRLLVQDMNYDDYYNFFPHEQNKQQTTTTVLTTVPTTATTSVIQPGEDRQTDHNDNNTITPLIKEKSIVLDHDDVKENETVEIEVVKKSNKNNISPNNSHFHNNSLDKNNNKNDNENNGTHINGKNNDFRPKRLKYIEDEAGLDDTVEEEEIEEERKNFTWDENLRFVLPKRGMTIIA